MYPIIFQPDFSIHQINRPSRIVSLVPSQTELLFNLGLDERVVGISRYCVHPRHWLETKTIIGGTKKIDVEAIRALQPDLIIANKEENVKEQVEALAAFSPVYVSEVNNLGSALEMILQTGLLVNAKLQAELLVHQLVLDFETLEKKVTEKLAGKKLAAAYLIWRKPYMVAGGDTFISDMLQKCGLQNVFIKGQRYPAISIEDLQQAAPDILIFSSEPYPFRQKHLEALQADLPQTKMLLADGEMFSWYGSRLLSATTYFSEFVQTIATLSYV